MGTPSITHPFRRRTLALSLLLCAPPALSQTITTTVPLILPTAVTFDRQGNLYIAETGNHVIRKVDTLGNLTTIAGNTTQGFSGDTGSATAAQLDSPQGLAVTPTSIYIADTHNHRIRRLDLATGLITTIAGTGSPSFSGDAGPATSATLNLPTALATDTLGNLYLADTANHRIRKITISTGVITTIAGTGSQGYSGDTGPANLAAIDSPTGLALDSSNNLYLADTHNHRIRRIDAIAGVITTIAGTGALGQSGDTAPATSSQLALPHGLTIDAAGNLYLADTANHRIRRIDAATGIITTIAGTGTQGFSGDNGLATAARLDSPRATTVSPSQITFSDTNNQRVRQISAAMNPDTLTLASPSPIVYGTGQLTATLTAATPATGSITFLDSSTGNTFAIVPLTSDIAFISTGTLPAGVHTIVATYPGDLTHTSASSTPFTLTITPAPTITTLTLPPSLGTNVTLLTQVATTTTGTPTGTITILDTSSPIATAPLTPSAADTFSVAAFAPGTHTLVASYSGDSNFKPSVSAPSILNVASPIPADFTLTATGAITQTASATSTTFTFTAVPSATLTTPHHPRRLRRARRSQRRLQPRHPARQPRHQCLHPHHQRHPRSRLYTCFIHLPRSVLPAIGVHPPSHPHPLRLSSSPIHRHHPPAPPAETASKSPTESPSPPPPRAPPARPSFTPPSSLSVMPTCSGLPHCCLGNHPGPSSRNTKNTTTPAKKTSAILIPGSRFTSGTKSVAATYNVTPADSGNPARTQVGSKLIAKAPSTVVTPNSNAEFNAARLLRPPASITLATVKPSGTLCRNTAKNSTHPSHRDTTNPDPIAIPSKNVCTARPSITL